MFCNLCKKECKIKHIMSGGYICHNCYLKTYRTPIEVCSFCGERKNIYVRNPVILCQSCYLKQYKPPERSCKKCDLVKPIHSGGLCKCCYKRQYEPPKRICVVCKKLKSGCNLTTGRCLSCHNSYRAKTDEQFAIRISIRKRISKVLKRQGVSKKFLINYSEILDHLGPCPGERKDYHIDHIFPLSAFDLIKDQHLMAAVAPENHQWLRKEINCSKKDSYDVIKFYEYLSKFGQ